MEELKSNDKQVGAIYKIHSNGDNIYYIARWVLPALKQIKEICSLYQEQPATGVHGGQRTAAVVYRSEVINRLEQSHALVIQIADNLTSYMATIRAGGEAVAKMDPAEFSPDGRYSHTAQVSERLNFLRFLLRDGQLWLCAPQAKQIWRCLAEDAVFSSDREICFKWFSKLMGDEPDLDPEINRDFFESNLLKASFDTVTVLQEDKGDRGRMEVELLRLCRVLCVLFEYVSECDAEYQEERSCIPLYRAARGKHLTLTVRFPNSGHKVEDMEFWVHDNDTLASLRRMVFQKLKASPMNIKLELFSGQEVLDVADDRKILALLPLKDKAVITAKLSQTGAGAGASSPDSSSESSGGSPAHHLYEVKLRGTSSEHLQMILLLTLFRVPT